MVFTSFGRCRTTLVRLEPTMARIRPTPGEFEGNWHGVGQLWPARGQIRTMSTEFGRWIGTRWPASPKSAQALCRLLGPPSMQTSGPLPGDPPIDLSQSRAELAADTPKSTMAMALDDDMTTVTTTTNDEAVVRMTTLMSVPTTMATVPATTNISTATMTTTETMTATVTTVTTAMMTTMAVMTGRR